MNIQELHNRNVQIDNYQSTFLSLKCDQKLYRFDIFGKQEFDLEKGAIAELEYFESHPLLINYSENVIVTFINSKPKDSEKFVEEIENAIDEITQGWRSWKDYITDENFYTFETFLKNVNDGNGKLLAAPSSITQNVLKVCEKHNVAVKAFDNNLQTKCFKLITIGRNYIIAKEFKYNEKN